MQEKDCVNIIIVQDLAEDKKTFIIPLRSLKFWTPAKLAVITLKFEQGGSTAEWYVQKIQIE